MDLSTAVVQSYDRAMQPRHFMPLAVVPLALLAATACLGPKEYGPDESPSGEAIYAGSNCSMCHGKDLMGTSLGPSLADAEVNWTVETLMEYFEEPEVVIAKSPRLMLVAQGYSTDMPPYDGLLPKHQRALAEYVIETARGLDGDF